MLKDVLTMNVYFINQNLNMTGLAVHTILYWFRKIIHINRLTYVLECAPTCQKFSFCSFIYWKRGCELLQCHNYELWDTMRLLHTLHSALCTFYLWQSFRKELWISKIDFHFICSSPFLTYSSLVESFVPLSSPLRIPLKGFLLGAISAHSSWSRGMESQLQMVTLETASNLENLIS